MSKMLQKQLRRADFLKLSKNLIKGKKESKSKVKQWPRGHQ